MSKQIQVRRAFVAFHLVLALVVFVQSLTTVLSSVGFAAGRPVNLHLVVLGSLEAVFAVIFMLPRTVRAGAIGLIAVFLFASVLHLLQGEFPGALLVYGVGAAFVALHGAAYSKRPPTEPAAALAQPINLASAHENH